MEFDLTSNAVLRMFSGEVVEKPILQVLSSKIDHSCGFEITSLVLSDGENFSEFFFNPLLHDPLLQEQFTILQVNQYKVLVTDAPNGGKETSIHIEAASVLELGSAIGHGIGCPKNFEDSFAEASNDGDGDDETLEACGGQAELRIPFKWSILSKRAPLTNHALSCIIDGKQHIEKPIVQILSAKVSPYQGKDCLLLFITDGRQAECIWCVTALTSLRSQLERLSIVQLDRYEYTGRSIEVLEMTGLNLGSHVCFGVSLVPRRAALTEGFISQVVNNGTLAHEPIVQVQKIREVRNASELKNRLRLRITDGQYILYAYLSTQLEHRLRGSLVERCIVRLDSYKANHVTINHRSSITVFSMTLLNIGTVASFDWLVMPGVPTLSREFIARLIVGDKMPNPVVKILQLRMIYNGLTHQHFIRLLIYDGRSVCRADLPSYLNYLHATLDVLPAVRLDSYSKQVKDIDECRLVIYGMTGLNAAPNYLPQRVVNLDIPRAILPNLDVNL